MKVSVVTPVLNDRRVGRALDSVLRQEHDRLLELVVIDGGSTDGTLDVLERYRDKIVLMSEPDHGIYDAMNKGIERATGDIVGILNADDQYNGRFVLRDVAAAFDDPTVGACYGNLVYVNSKGQVVRYWKAGRSRRLKWHLGWMPPHPTFFVRKCVYQRHGLFNLGFPIAADYELMLRLIVKHKIPPAYLDRVLVKMAPGGNANRSALQVIKANLEVSRAWRVNRLRGGFLVPFLKPGQKVFQFLSRPPDEGRLTQGGTS